jgi:hypothetical protein
MKTLEKMKEKMGVFGLNSLTAFITLLVVAGIVLTIGIFVVDEVEDQMTTGSEAEAAANTTIEALGDIADWFAIIVVVVIAVIIIGLVVSAFSQRSGR